MRLTRGLQILGALVTSLFLLGACTPTVNLPAYWGAPGRTLGPADAIGVLGDGDIAESGQLSQPPLQRIAEVIELYRQLIGQAFLLALVVVTSVAAYALEVGAFDLSPRRLLAAVLFRAVPGTTGTFASAYNGNSLCVLSAPDGECCGRARGSRRDRR